MRIQRLSRNVSAAVLSTSSISTQVSVLKELLENAIDAVDNKTELDADAYAQIQIELDKDSAGLDYMLVRDSGVGVSKNDRNLMCLNCTTSKLHSVDDLSKGVKTCGFRGEALNLIARISDTMVISTKTEEDTLVESWSVNKSGLPNTDAKMVPGANGTSVKVTGLFHSTPVRYKYLKEQRKRLLKALDEVVLTFAIIYRKIRFQIIYVKFSPNGRITLVENKTFSNKFNREHFFYDALDVRKKGWLENSDLVFEIHNMTQGSLAIFANVLLPTMTADFPIIKNSLKILAVNSRPLNLSLRVGKLILRMINEIYTRNGLLKPCVWYISLTFPTNSVDFNIEPEKSDIIIVNEEKVLERLSEELNKTVRKQHKLENEDALCAPSKSHQALESQIANNNSIDHGITITQKTSENKPERPSTFEELAEHFVQSDDESLVRELESTIKSVQMQAIDNGLSFDNRNELDILLPCSGKIGPNTKSDITENMCLDSTVQQKKEKHHRKTIINRDCNQQENREDTIHSIDDGHFGNFDISEGDDAEWSHTIYNTTRLSSELDVPSISLNPNKELSHQLTASVQNSSSLANFSYETHDSSKYDGSTLVEPSTLLAKPLRDAAFVKSPSPLSHANTGKTPKKQTSLTSFGTYILREPLKASTDSSVIRLPRITECSKHTKGTVVKVPFDLTLDSKNRIIQLEDDENWTGREGIPSSTILEGASKLYESTSYNPSRVKLLREVGIYRYA